MGLAGHVLALRADPDAVPQQHHQGQRQHGDVDHVLPDAVEPAADPLGHQGQRQRTGWAVPFVVHDAAGGIVGTTRFCNIDVANKRVEIGWTWYAQRVQRTALNTAAKLLLLTHAFENLGAGVVELRTSYMNIRSRAAIARLGAKQDGILRNHMKLPDGGYRDTVVFSIIESEWPAVKRNLQFLLETGGQR